MSTMHTNTNTDHRAPQAQTAAAPRAPRRRTCRRICTRCLRTGCLMRCVAFFLGV
jgi:hypothetical protein